MYEYVYIYVNIKMLWVIYRHTYMHTSMHTYIHTQFTDVHPLVDDRHVIWVTYIHAGIHAYVHACMHTHMHACIRTYMHAYIHNSQIFIDVSKAVSCM
jgi:hypothetical protein